MIKKSLKTLRNKWHTDMLDASENNVRSINTNTVYLKGITSYIANETLIRQGVAEQTIQYKCFRALHEALELRSIDSSKYCFVRIGKDNDGGYLMVSSKQDGSLTSCKVAYSLGICHDVSFDLALAKRGYEIFQYDHTIEALPEENKHFHWRKLGVTGKKETRQLKSLETILKLDKNRSRKDMLLKCDIEGSEWDMLADCSSETLSRFEQIVIEFPGLHDLSKQKRTLAVLEKLGRTHQAVHIHSNNWTSVVFSGELITPDVFEVTYVLKSKYKTGEYDTILPCELDQPNNPQMTDIPLGRWNVR